MKKTLFAIATLALITTACSGNSKENGNDSVTADTTEATMRQEEKVDTFYSPDLAMHELHGHVKECLVETSDAKLKDGKFETKGKWEKGGALLFSDNGFIAKDEFFTYAYLDDGKIKAEHNKNKGSFGKVKRNKNGQIVKMEYDDPKDETMTWKTEYVWNKAGHPGKESAIGWEWNYDTEYTYNANGYLTKSVETSGDMESTDTTTITYEYVSFDKNGNWTERNSTVKIVSKMTDSEISVGQPAVSSEKRYYSERRKITYWE